MHKPLSLPCNVVTSRAASSGAGADAIKPPAALRWFVIKTHPQAERMVARELAERGYTAFLPMVSERKPDRVLPTMSHVVTVPFFPGYLFVQGDRTHDVWAPVVYCPGVQKLFSTPDLRPIPVREGVIEALQDSAGERMIIRGLPQLVLGERLRLTAGPLADQEGICQWSNETRTRLLMQILGAEVVVEVARSSVETA